jgi:hypothetical protein
MSSGESGESLASRLADAEAALLFARVNEKRLSEENHRYRERCEELSTQLLEAATPAAPVATAKPPRVPDASAQADHEDRVLNLFLTDGKTLSERTVPGLVGAPNGALAFGTVSATVSGAEFVGLRPLRARRDEASSKPPTQPQRWMSDRISDMLSRGNDDENADVAGNADFDEEGADALPRRARRRSGSVASDASGDASSFRDSDNEEEASEETERDANGGTDGLLQSKRNAPQEESLKTYEIVWKEGGGAGPLRRLAFEANRSGLAYVKKRVQAWSLEARQGGDAHERAARDAEEASNAIREEMRRASLSPRLDAVENRGEKKLSTSKTKPTALPLGPHAARLSEPSAIFSEDVARRLTSALPARLRLRDWKMAYSSKRDGISLRSLYRAAAREASAKNGSSAESLLFVRDSRGNAFGAFLTEPWRVHQRYYGTGESFVFTVDDQSSSRTSGRTSEKDADDAKEKNQSGVFAFRWSQRNDYFMFGRADCAAVGGGNGFALWLDEELLRGNSASSETFDNPCLSGGVKDFEIVYVELWTFAARNA